MCTDVASDAFRAGRLSTGASVSEFTAPIFENVQIHARDPTHASTRLTMAWRFDKYLWNVFGKFVWDVGSPAALIEHSPDIARITQDQIAKIGGPAIDGAQVRNMKLCKPRFDSTQAPLSRCILFFGALVATMIIVANTRTGKSADCAKVVCISSTRRASCK